MTKKLNKKSRILRCRTEQGFVGLIFMGSVGGVCRFKYESFVSDTVDNNSDGRYLSSQSEKVCNLFLEHIHYLLTLPVIFLNYLVRLVLLKN